MLSVQVIYLIFRTFAVYI